MTNVIRIGVDQRNVICILTSGSPVSVEGYTMYDIPDEDSLPLEMYTNFVAGRWLYIDEEIVDNPDYAIYAPLGMFYNSKTGNWEYPPVDPNPDPDEV